MPAQHAAVLAARDGLVGEVVFGKERQHVADGQQLAVLLGRGDHPLGIGRFQGDGLFAKNVFAGVEGGHGDRGMPGGRQADVDHVDLGVGQQPSSSPYRAMPERSIIVPCGPKLPLMVRQSPARRCGSCSQMAATRAADLLVGQIMDHAHEAEAGNTDVDH